MNDIAFIVFLSIISTVLVHFNFRKLRNKKAFKRVFLFSVLYAFVPLIMRFLGFINGRNEALSIMLMPFIYLIIFKLIDTLYLKSYKRNIILYTAGEKLTKEEKSQRTIFEILISLVVIVIPLLLTISIMKSTNSFIVVNSLEKNIYVSHNYDSEKVIEIEPETKCFFYEKLGFKRKVKDNLGFSLTFYKKNVDSYEKIRSIFIKYEYLESNDWNISLD